MTAPDDRSAQGRGGLNPPRDNAPGDRSAQRRGGLNPPRDNAPDDRSAQGRGGLNPPRDNAPDDRSAGGHAGRLPPRQVASEEQGAPGFFSRWSRLKRGEMTEPAAEPPTPPVSPPAEEAEAFDLSLLPSIEDLTAGSDISPFLKKGVPQALRQAALRKIWTLDPAIRDFVGPAEYAWDFNTPGGIPGVTEPLAGEVAELLARAIGVARPQEGAPPQAAATPPAATTDEVPLAAAQQPPQLPAAEPPPPEAGTASPRRPHGGAAPT